MDEDVGSCFVGKCFGVRSFEGVRYSFVDRGLREEQAPPLRVCAYIAATHIEYANLYGAFTNAPCGTMPFSQTSRLLAINRGCGGTKAPPYGIVRTKR